MPIDYEDIEFFKTTALPAGQYPRDMYLDDRITALETGANMTVPGLNITGPWVGPATPPDALGVDPATGDRYYVDDSGVWQRVEDDDLNTTREAVTGPAPASGTIPAEVTTQTDREDGDFHIISFDDYAVVYQFGTPITESGRRSLVTGGFESITANTQVPLVPNTKEGWLREYVITATAPITQITVMGETQPRDVVEFTVPAPNGPNGINIVWNSTEEIFLNGPIDDDGLVLNVNSDELSEVKLRPSGAVWVSVK